MAKKKDGVARVRFELVEPYTRFQCGLADGSALVVEAGGFETDDPALIGLLDQQTHALRRG